MVYVYRVIFIIFSLTILSCTRNLPNECKDENRGHQILDSITSLESLTPIILNTFKENENLIAINNKDIYIDLKYATKDNFMGEVLYSSIKTVYLQKDVVERLYKCQSYLSNIDSNLHLLVYDGLRPLSVQQKMWKALDTLPINQRVKFVSNPKNGSVHNYGAAIDLTICDNNRNVLDMGAGYDDVREIAYPKYEEKFLSTGDLSQQQVNNRKLLRKIMRKEGFRNIPTEWWHFNACSRKVAKEKYKIILEE